MILLLLLNLSAAFNTVDSGNLLGCFSVLGLRGPLSPVLFDIYLKLLGKVFRRCGLQCHQYENDTQLYLSFSPTVILRKLLMC